jgi:hypothetical protein
MMSDGNLQLVVVAGDEYSTQPLGNDNRHYTNYFMLTAKSIGYFSYLGLTRLS